MKNNKIECRPIVSGNITTNPMIKYAEYKIPFKLKFSTIGNGVDILTSVRVSQLMDAADQKGNQLDINLNSTQIKLTGYNNF